MPGKDSHVQAIRGALESKHGKSLVDIIFIFRPLVSGVLLVGVRTSVNVGIQVPSNVSIGISKSSESQRLVCSLDREDGTINNCLIRCSTETKACDLRQEVVKPCMTMLVHKVQHI